MPQLQKRQAGAEVTSIEVTPEMIAAGILAWQDAAADDYVQVPCEDDLVTSVFRAMRRVSLCASAEQD